MRGQLWRDTKGTVEEAVKIWVVLSVGGVADQPPHPSFSCTGQGGAQPIVAVVQLPVGLPDDKIQVERWTKFRIFTFLSVHVKLMY